MNESREPIRVRRVDDAWAIEYPDGSALRFASAGEAVIAAHKLSIEYGRTFVFEAESDQRYANPS